MITEEKYKNLIETLNHIGIALSGEEDRKLLLKKILTGAMQITNADGGTLYLTHANKLSFAFIANVTLGIPPSHVIETNLILDSIPLYLDNEPNLRNIASSCYHQNKTINISDAYNTERFDFSGMRLADKKLGYRSKSFLAIPMRDHEKNILGILQLINAKDEESNEIIPFDDSRVIIAESLASQAAVILTKFELIKAQKKLFESLLRLLAHAIDEKSLHTSNHCTRVPIITKMIAEAFNKNPIPNSDKQFFSKLEMDELMIAAWLHDCGKIVTPDHVVNKSTKLETIVDKIDLVNTRIEILIRDAKIDYLEKRLSDEQYQSRIQFLKEAKEFLNQANTGGEFLSNDDIERIKFLGSNNFYISDNIKYPLLTEMETNNLCIQRGTLNDEERQIIQNHVKITHEMLHALPYPRDLKNVPEIAGSHHERMDGKGYPYGKQKEEIMLQARILAIADIFEALTSADRPYKTAKTLKEVLGIMNNMKTAGHIDPNIYDLFIKEKIYLTYANEFLKPEQIDIE